MGRRADFEDCDDNVWIDFEMALSRCPIRDRDKVRAILAEYGLTVVRLSAIEHAGTMLRDTLKRKPMFKISFVLNPVDPNSQTVAVDFAASQVEANRGLPNYFPYIAREGRPVGKSRGAMMGRLRLDRSAADTSSAACLERIDMTELTEIEASAKQWDKIETDGVVIRHLRLATSLVEVIRGLKGDTKSIEDWIVRRIEEAAVVGK